MNMCFSGPSGMEEDKKCAAEYVADRLYTSGMLPSKNIVAVDATALRGKHIGETQKNILEVAQKANGGVLFITDLFGFDSPYVTENLIREATEALTAATNLYRESLCIILAVDEETVEKVLYFSNAMARRFPARIHFTKSAREEFMESINLLEQENREKLEEDFKNEINLWLNRKSI